MSEYGLYNKWSHNTTVEKKYLKCFLIEIHVQKTLYIPLLKICSNSSEQQKYFSSCSQLYVYLPRLSIM